MKIAFVTQCEYYLTKRISFARVSFQLLTLIIKLRPVLQPFNDLQHFSTFICWRTKKVQVGKDQEKAQSEKDSHSKNRGGKKTNYGSTKVFERKYIMCFATSATICIYVYVCNSLICHSFGFKRIKLCLSVCNNEKK